MLICPNCNHTNPEGATQCEACYTLLPQMIHCPHCDALIQTDATFCGSCGNSVTAQPAVISAESSVPREAESPHITPEIPPIAEQPVPVKAIARPQTMPIPFNQCPVINVGSIGTAHIFDIVSISF